MPPFKDKVTHSPWVLGHQISCFYGTRRVTITQRPEHGDRGGGAVSQPAGTFPGLREAVSPSEALQLLPSVLGGTRCPARPRRPGPRAPDLARPAAVRRGRRAGADGPSFRRRVRACRLGLGRPHSSAPYKGLRARLRLSEPQGKEVMHPHEARPVTLTQMGMWETPGQPVLRPRDQSPCPGSAGGRGWVPPRVGTTPRCSVTCLPCGGDHLRAS